MKVGILSDTHIRKGRTLPLFVWDTLSDVDIILHAGDIVTKSLLEDLKIGMTHGCHGGGKNTPEKAYNVFREDNVNLIVFGHSHAPYKSFINGVLLFNPGSPTERRGQEHYSLGILTVEGDVFDVQHLFFKGSPYLSNYIK